MRRLWPLLPLLLSAGCLEEPSFDCQTDEVCVFEGYPGVCDLATTTCVYPSAECRGINSIEGWVDGQGNCVPAPSNVVGSGPSSTTSGNGGTTDAPTTEPETSDSNDETSGTSEPINSESTSGAETSSSGGDESSTGEPACGEQMLDITNYGVVMASTVFNGYPETNGIDGDLTTSWFSTGPEGGGGPSVYGWLSEDDRCIRRIEVEDNSQHSNPEFRTGYGFSSATIRILQNDLVVFEELVPLPNDPDGFFAVDTGGIYGSRVLLEMAGHENVLCGGFSELRLFGASG